MTTLGAVLDQAIRKGGIGEKIASGDFTIDSGTTLTAPKYFRDGGTVLANNSLLGNWLLRPQAATASEADHVRVITALTATSGQFTVDTTMSDTTATSEDLYVLPRWCRPIRLVQAANLALDRIYTGNIEMLSTKPTGAVVADASFQNAATSSYTASSTTFTKVSTANSYLIHHGFGAGKLANAGYIYQNFDIEVDGEPVYLYSLGMLASGTAVYNTLYDSTGSATIGTPVSHAQSGYMWMVQREQMPAGSKILQVRHGVSGTSDVGYFNGQCVYFPNRDRLILDTKWDTDFKATELVAFVPNQGTSTDGLYGGSSSDKITVNPADYNFVREGGGPNPTAIQWHNNAQRTWYRYPLAISGRRPLGDLNADMTLSSWATDVVGADIDLWDAATRLELFGMADIRRSYPEANTELAKANFDFQALSAEFHRTSSSRGRNFTGRTFVRN